MRTRLALAGRRQRSSGVEMEVRSAYLIEVRAGKVVGVTQYGNVDAAQRAVGLAG
jgi:ketosteroid isomerase-like protein